jgi:NitT/TauT family transport system substrate-binding protein
MTITLQESLRGLFYAPFYAALAQDRYAAEGVDVRFVSAPRPGDAATTVMGGAADVCWGGPMRVMQTYHNDPDCDLVCFGEVVTRDPFMLIGRSPRPDFKLRDLVALTVATVSEVPTPWMCLQEDLRRADIAPASLRRVSDRSMAENCAALLRGEVDVVQVFEPFVSQAVSTGKAHVWYAAADRGPTSYTTFYARRQTLADRHDELLRMVRAIYKTQQWVGRASGAEIGEAIASYFPELPPAIRTAACERYESLGIWGGNPILPRAGYDRLKASLVSGAFVNPGTPFETAVDNRLAEDVVREQRASA